MIMGLGVVLKEKLGHPDRGLNLKIEGSYNRLGSTTTVDIDFSWSERGTVNP